MASSPPSTAPEPERQPAGVPLHGVPRGGKVASLPTIGPTIRQLLADACARHANRPALLIKPGFRTRSWTYRDLADQGPRVARVLSDMGLRAGDRLIVWAVNRPEWGLAFLGALHAGIYPGSAGRAVAA